LQQGKGKPLWERLWAGNAMQASAYTIETVGVIKLCHQDMSIM
jgi:hypothetical protein